MASAVEYALMIAQMTIVMFSAVPHIGKKTRDAFNTLTDALDNSLRDVDLAQGPPPPPGSGENLDYRM